MSSIKHRVKFYFHQSNRSRYIDINIVKAYIKQVSSLVAVDEIDLYSRAKPVQSTEQ